MRTFLSLTLLLFGTLAKAQARTSTTEAGIAYCLTCADAKGFITLSSDQMRDLDKIMTSTPATKSQAILPKFIGPLDPNEAFRVKVEKKKEFEPRVSKLQVIYSVDQDPTSQFALGLNKNSQIEDPTAVTNYLVYKRPKTFGLKYTKKFKHRRRY